MIFLPHYLNLMKFKSNKQQAGNFMETNQYSEQIKDLSTRATELRGYL